MRSIRFDRKSLMPYAHLEPLVDFLINNGNSLARSYRWGENRTGYVCFLAEPIDFDLIEKEFSLPSYIRLVRDTDTIECDKSWVSIKGGVAK